MTDLVRLKNFAVLSFLCFAACDRHEPLQLLEQDIPIEVPRINTFGVRLEKVCPKPGSRFSDAFFQNESMYIKEQKFLADWDRDGIPNVDDARRDFGFSFKEADSNGDGYSDLAVWVRGLNLEDQTGLKVCENFSQDTDLDGLTDCEENSIFKTNAQAFDTDGDGVPDGLEVRFGLNPLDSLDVFQDNDGDGITNSDEIRVGTPINESNTKAVEPYLIKVDIGKEKLKNEDECLWIQATNIPQMAVSNGNLVRAYVIEIDAEGKSQLRRMTVVAASNLPDKTLIKRDFKEDTQ
jgi:hypothetical protein